MDKNFGEILNINKYKEIIAHYVRIKIELFKLDLTEHISNIIAQIIAYFIIFNIAMFVLAFASIGAANALNSSFDSEQIGYWIVSAFYLIILFIVLIYLKSGKLKELIESKINHEAFSEDSDLDE